MPGRSVADHRKRCQRCRQDTLALRREPVLTETTGFALTGTDAHDGRRNRLRYEDVWLCENPRCGYRESE
jgi:hypothetical protein